MRKITIAALASLIILSACSSQEAEETKAPAHQEKKSVEVFDLRTEQIETYISKNGSAKAEFIAQVSPQINGRVIKIQGEVGQTVKKGQTLLTLGDSLNTNVIDLQEASSRASAEIASESLENTKVSAEISSASANLSAEAAYLNYQQALTNKDTTARTQALQRQQAEITLYNAEKNYRDVYDTYLEAKGKSPRSYYRNYNFKLDELESNFEGSSRSLSDPESPANSNNDLETALKTAETQLQQAEIALRQIDSTQSSQTAQLNYAIESAKKQYEAALLQTEASAVQSNQQILASESQLVQAQTGADSAKLNSAEKTIRSPISGFITEIIAKEGNLVSPGQTLVKIENDELLSVTTSLTAEEARLITSNKVLVQYNDNTVEGSIVSISPTLDEQSKKAEVEIEVEKNNLIPTGAFVKIHFPITNSRSIFLPLNSIFIEGSSKKVRVLTKENSVAYKEVKVGEIVGDFAEITQGLKGDEVVITTVNLFLEEGEQVLVKVPNERK